MLLTTCQSPTPHLGSTDYIGKSQSSWKLREFEACVLLIERLDSAEVIGHCVRFWNQPGAILAGPVAWSRGQ